MRAIKLDDVDHKIILIGVGLVILTALFPPWSYTFDSPGRSGGSMHSEKPAGYGFIFLPPSPEKKSGASYGIQIDFGRMFLQWFLVAAICAAIIMYLRIEKNRGIIELKDIVLEEDIKETPDRGKEWAQNYIASVLADAAEQPDNKEVQAKAEKIRKEQ